MSDAGADGRPDFLLVHGAWRGAWCFAPLVEALERRLARPEALAELLLDAASIMLNDSLV